MRKYFLLQSANGDRTVITRGNQIQCINASKLVSTERLVTVRGYTIGM